jgi:hypothetical protein
MKYLLVSLPLLLAACAAPGAPSLSQPAAPVTVSAQLAVSNSAGRQVLATVTPWTATDIHQAVVSLYTDTGTEAITSQTLAQGELGKTLTFTNLRHDTAYRLVTTAFAADGDDADTDPDPIHDPDVTTCTTRFTTTTDTLLTLTDGIQLELRDKVFSGATSGNTVTVTPGTLTHTGAEGISVQ